MALDAVPGSEGPNVIGNEEDVDLVEAPVSGMAGLNVNYDEDMSGQRAQNPVPAGIKGTVRTRKEKKAGALMQEASRRTQAALGTMNAEMRQ